MIVCSFVKLRKDPDLGYCSSEYDQLIMLLPYTKCIITTVAVTNFSSTLTITTFLLYLFISFFTIDTSNIVLLVSTSVRVVKFSLFHYKYY